MGAVVRGADRNGDMTDASPVTRRDFLQAAGLGSAGLFLADDSGVAAALARVAADGTVQSQQFAVAFNAGAITSLKRVGDAFDTDYIASGRRLGDAIVRYRQGPGEWQTLDTATLTQRQVSTAGEG